MDSGNLSTDAKLVGKLKGSLISGIQDINVNDVPQEISGHTANLSIDFDIIKDKPSLVVDDDYVHTDNNYSDEEKNKLNNKQDVLVSGENIKTINNQSLLGSGDISISGGGAITVFEITDGHLIATSTDTEALTHYSIENNHLYVEIQ